MLEWILHRELINIIERTDVSDQVKINAIDCLFRNARPIIEQVDIISKIEELESRKQDQGSNELF